MEQESIKKVETNPLVGLKIALLLIAAIALIYIVPTLLIWIVNSIAASGGFPLVYSIWNYF